MANRLTDDIAAYLKLTPEYPVNAAAQFTTMLEKYRYRRRPQHRYEFLEEADRHGAIVAPPELASMARERHTYTDDMPAWDILTETMQTLYHVGGTMEYDVYADEETVWVDDGETLMEVETVEAAMALDELMDTYHLVRDMDATAEAKEQFDQIRETYAIGFIDPEQDMLLLYDIEQERGYLFDTHAIELHEMDQSLTDLFDELVGDRDTDVAESGMFDRLLDDKDDV